MRTHLLHSLLALLGLTVIVAIFFPPHPHNRHSARRASCQSNLKQIGLALQMYAQDNSGYLPSRQWGKPLMTYVKEDAIFQCPETPVTPGANDYFFNARFVGALDEKITSPGTLILTGDGANDAGFDATLMSIPPLWSQNENSPASRHLVGANYGFADGHVKFLKVGAINHDFRVVMR